MKYSTVFRIADNLNEFINGSMINMGHTPGKVSVELMVWRMSNTKIGIGLLDRYAKALEDPRQWRATVVAALHTLVNIIKDVEGCANSTRYKAIDEMVLDRQDRTKLKHIINEAKGKCRRRGYSADELFDYIEECRNIFTHSGTMPLAIKSGNRSLGLNSFLLTPFIDSNPVTPIAHKNGTFKGQGDNAKYEALCKLLFAALCFYFDSLNPSLSKFAALRHTVLVISMGLNAVKRTFRLIFDGIYYGVAASFGLLSAAAYIVAFLAIAAIVVVFVNWILGFFNGSHDTYRLTETDPAQLTAWVEEMTPYEQMEFLELRRSSLVSADLFHRVGDPVISPSDSVTEALYTEFRDCPDPTAHPLKFFLNAGNTSRIPVLGWPMGRQWGGEKLFTSQVKGAIGKAADYLPIYQGDYYPVCQIYSPERVRMTADDLAEAMRQHKGIEIALLRASGSSGRHNEETAHEIARSLKKAITAAGIKASRIRIMDDPTEQAGVTVAVGNLPDGD